MNLPVPLFGHWCPVVDCLPALMDSVIVWGVLDGENEPDSHDGFLGLAGPERWRSVRLNEDDGSNRNIIGVSHWMPRPRKHNVQKSGTRTQRSEYNPDALERCLHFSCSLFELDDLLYALENAAEFLENEEWPESADKARQEAANRDGARRIRRMVKRLNKANAEAIRGATVTAAGATTNTLTNDA